MTPTNDQFATAVFWLNSNAGSAEEIEACRAVARWIEAEIKDRFIKQEARKAGVPVARLRKAIKRTLTERLRVEMGGVYALER